MVLVDTMGSGKFHHSDTPVTLHLGSDIGDKRHISGTSLCILWSIAGFPFFTFFFSSLICIYIKALSQYTILTVSLISLKLLLVAASA
jgi:hypothetical protein